MPVPGMAIHTPTHSVPLAAETINSPGYEAAIIRVLKALVTPSGIISRVPATFHKPPLVEVHVANIDVDLGIAREAMSLSIHWICSGVKGTTSLPSFVSSLSLMMG